MREVAIAVTIAAMLAALGMVPPSWAVYGGAAATVGGLAVGAPAGFVYHVRLARVLGPRDQLTPRWWWNPTPLNRHLEGDDERVYVMAPFYLGALGAAVSVAGAVFFGVGAWRGLLAVL